MSSLLIIDRLFIIFNLIIIKMNLGMKGKRYFQDS